MPPARAARRAPLLAPAAAASPETATPRHRAARKRLPSYARAHASTASPRGASTNRCSAAATPSSSLVATTASATACTLGPACMRRGGVLVARDLVRGCRGRWLVQAGRRPPCRTADRMMQGWWPGVGCHTCISDSCTPGQHHAHTHSIQQQGRRTPPHPQTHAARRTPHLRCPLRRRPPPAAASQCRSHHHPAPAAEQQRRQRHQMHHTHEERH